MKSEKKILLAFVLNFVFSIFEFVGGIFTGSVAIASDAVHDIGDAASIGMSYFLEKKSNRAPNAKYTYGYKRFSVLGSIITTLILLVGSVIVIYNSVLRIIYPTPINYNGMIIFAVIGVAVNFLAAFFTREGHSLNQKAVNLHMLEDVLGWAVVLVGAVIMRFTDIAIIDPIMSVGVALFILFNVARNLKEIVDLFLEKTPRNIDIDEIKEHVCDVEGVIDVHHIHVWSMDGYINYATMHVVTDNKCSYSELKKNIREELREHGIGHVTLEIEDCAETCGEKECRVEEISHHFHHSHHSHHSHHGHTH